MDERHSDIHCRLPAASQPAAEDYSFLCNKQILVVEDNAVNQLVTLQILGKAGCVADTAVNGIEAIEKVQQKPFDLILMDCQMPEMDGLEATRRIRKLMKTGKTAHIPIIALTAHAAQRDKEKCLDAGMNDYLLKPIQKNDMLNMLQKWLSVQETARET